MLLTRELCRSVTSFAEPRFDLRPLQLGMGGDPWRVVVASMLLCRSRRVQAEPCLRGLLARWPDAAALAVAEGVEEVVKPCGLQRNRARQLVRFSNLWLSDGWEELRELPGVGVYVADAVALFCFGCRNLESNDGVLHAHARTLAGAAPILHHQTSHR
jgi:endonuclease III